MSASGFEARMIRTAAPNFRQNRYNETKMAMSRTTRPGQFIQGPLQITRQSNVAAVPYAPANGAQATGSAQPAKDCRCSKIMSPHNCNETLSPCKDGDDESERVPTGESDCECSGREAKCTRSRPSAAD